MTGVELTVDGGTIVVGDAVHAQCVACLQERDCAAIRASVAPEWIVFMCGQCITTALARYMTDCVAVAQGRDRAEVAHDIAEQAQQEGSG